jgi:uracil-DNA glycosylase
MERRNFGLTKHAREELRLQYLPKSVRLLFVGESPPASGRFFYRQDSGLYRAVRDAFQTVDPKINDANFLARFQAAGCYLIDLTGKPVDDLPPAARREACRNGEPRLSQIISQFQPATILVLLRSIEPNVRRAAANAHWNGTLITTPYPGRWKHHRERFHEIVVPVLKTLNLKPSPQRAD